MKIPKDLLIMLLLSLVQMISYYKTNSLGCLGVFGLTYLLTMKFTKNLTNRLLMATVVSITLFSCNKTIEGNDIMGCGDNIIPQNLTKTKKTKPELETIKGQCETAKKIEESKLAEPNTSPDEIAEINTKIRDFTKKIGFVTAAIGNL
jgi:hypothetical protein